MTIHPSPMRRSTVLLAGAVAIAGAAALLGGRDGTTALVQGAPLEPTTADSAPAGDVAKPQAPSKAAVKRTQAGLAELLDLDKLKLVDDHYVAALKDGRHAVLTLDPDLQSYAEKLLREARAPRGAIVAMAPDGRILALAGRRAEPKAKANDGIFDWRLATEVWAPAASVFKLVTASALVAAGVDPTGKVCFHGGIRSVTDSNLRDDKSDSRCESLAFGVAHSNNAILGKLAFQKLAPDALTKFAHMLGVSESLTGGELAGVAGAVDIPAVHDLTFAKAAAGFTGSQLSAVGGALLAATFADSGEQPVPRLIASIDGVSQPILPRRRTVTADVARAVGKMMEATCEMGSASKSFGRRQAVRVAGKTGTLTRTAPFYMEHSWFVGYAPAEQPEIVVSVILGNPESWHLRGHEAARRLIDRALDHGKGHSAADRKERQARQETPRTAKKKSTRRVGW